MINQRHSSKLFSSKQLHAFSNFRSPRVLRSNSHRFTCYIALIISVFANGLYFKEEEQLLTNHRLKLKLSFKSWFQIVEPDLR